MVQSFVSWLQRSLRWSNSRESWQERAGLAAVLAMALFALLFGRRLSLSYQIVLWGLVLVALAVVLRRGWLRLFGPVLFYDLVRIARRSRYFLIRGVYGLFLLGLLCWSWFVLWIRSTYQGELRATDMAEFASGFFYMFMSIQFVIVTLLTPAYTASAVTDEKERRTLEFLLATDLRNREIVLSKLVSRLANLMLLLLVGLPVLAFLQFLGGVDPGLVLAGFAATALTVLSLASLSIFFSVVARKTRDAIALTYLTVIAYLALSASALLLQLLPTVASFPSTTAEFVATILVLLGLACLGIFCFFVMQRTRNSVVLAGLTAVVFLVVAALIILMKPYQDVPRFPADLPPPDEAKPPSASPWQSPATVDDLVNWVNTGNILVVVFRDLAFGVASGTPLDDTLPRVLRNYAIFHGLVAFLCATWAVLRLRAVYLAETYGKPQRVTFGLRFLLRPPVGNHPMVWKEVFAEQQVRFHWVGRIFVLLLVIGSFIPAGYLIVDHLWDYYFNPRGPQFSAWRNLGEEMNVWVRIVGTIVACLLLLGVAVRAAGSISNERDRQTYDSLLISPLDSTTILFGKWLGSVLSVRWGWVWLGAICALGLATQGLNPIAVPLLLAGWFIYAAFLGTVGLWFSMVSKSTLRAILWTLLVTVTVSTGHYLLWTCCVPFFIVSNPSRGMGELIEWIFQFEAFGLTPPVTLGFLAFHGHEFEYTQWSRRNHGLEFLICAIIGLGIYAAATASIWGATSARFRQLTGRTPFRRPERISPPRTRPSRLASTRPAPPAGPFLITEEASDDHVRPTELPEAILIEEEWKEEEKRE